MSSVRLTSGDVQRLNKWVDIYGMEPFIHIEEEGGGGIGSMIYVVVKDEENGFAVEKRYAISSVEDW